MTKILRVWAYIENGNGEYAKRKPTRPKSGYRRRQATSLQRSEKIPHPVVVRSWPLDKNVN